jgi:hypothetical protein
LGKNSSFNRIIVTAAYDVVYLEGKLAKFSNGAALYEAIKKQPTSS